MTVPKIQYILDHRHLESHFYGTMKIELRTRKALHPHRQARFSLAASDELLFFG